MEKVWAEVLNDPELHEMLAKNKQVPMYLNSADTMANMVKQYADFGATIESMGLAAK